MKWKIEEDKNLIERMEAGDTHKLIGLKLGRSEAAVRQRCYLRGIKSKSGWSESDDEKLVKMIKKGDAYEHIGLELGRSPGAVQVRSSNLGIIKALILGK